MPPCCTKIVFHKAHDAPVARENLSRRVGAELARLPLLAALAAAGASARAAAFHKVDNDLEAFAPRAVTVRAVAGASVATNASSPVRDGDFVLVAVVNPEFKQRGDFVAMYLADADPAATVPLKYTYLCVARFALTRSRTCARGAASDCPALRARAALPPRAGCPPSRSTAWTARRT